MPTYDYVCGACGHAFEQFQEMSAKKLRKCPKCAKPALERQVGAGAGLIFKGTGFYITDYKRQGAGAPTGAEAKGEGGSKEGPASTPGGAGGSGASSSASDAKPPSPPPPAPPAPGARGAAKAPSKAKE